VNRYAREKEEVAQEYIEKAAERAEEIQAEGRAVFNVQNSPIQTQRRSVNALNQELRIAEHSASKAQGVRQRAEAMHQQGCTKMQVINQEIRDLEAKFGTLRQDVASLELVEGSIESALASSQTLVNLMAATSERIWKAGFELKELRLIGLGLVTTLIGYGGACYCLGMSIA